MARPAKILIAGAIAATALYAGAASSQEAPSTVVNDQLQDGPVTAEQTIEVEGVDEGVVAVTTGTANSFDATVEQGSLNVESTQTTTGGVTANTWVGAGYNIGASSVVTTAATGNTGDANVWAGELTGTYNQTNSGAIIANGLVEAADSDAGDLSVSTQALANSQGFGLTDGASNVVVNQADNGDVLADGGGVVGYVAGDATFAAAAAGNNLTSVAVGDSLQTVSATQTNQSELVQASQFTAYGSVATATTSSTAAANNVTVDNETGPLAVATSQYNSAYTRAQAESTAYEFGGGAAIAYGVGNTLVAGAYGPDIAIDSEQFNEGGGVEAIASFTGYQGYDATSSATAIGNASSGFACSDCQGRMSVNNRQTNSADVAARSTTQVTGSGRLATGVSTAVGNTASYYVTRPNN